MKICLVVRALPCHRLGGLEYHTLDLANALAARGHELTILTSAAADGRREETLPSGVSVRYLGAGEPGNYSRKYFRALEPELEQLDRSRRFDVIHLQEFAGLFLKARKGRTVCTVHGTLFSETPLNRRFFRRLSAREKARTVWKHKPRLALAPFFKPMLQRADSLIVDSDYTRREILLLSGSLRPKITLVPLGVDLKRYPAGRGSARGTELAETTTRRAGEAPGTAGGGGGETAGPLRIALLGRVQRQKGLEVALRTAVLLHQRGVRFRMEIGGTGDYLPELRERIEVEGLASSCRVLGRIPESEMTDFYGRADLFLFPDLTQPAFGLVAVEAMLSGLPVVAARSGAIPEVVREEVGWLYEPWAAEEAANLLERLALDRTSVADKAARARTYAQDFSAERMAAGVESVYEQLREGQA